MPPRRTKREPPTNANGMVEGFSRETAPIKDKAGFYKVLRPKDPANSRSVPGHTTTQTLFDIAIFMTCGWRLAHGDRKFPVTPGVLDAAIEKNLELLTPEHVALLSFGNTRVGRRCYQLEDLLASAWSSLLLDGPTAEQISVRVNVNEDGARRMLTNFWMRIPRAIAFAEALARTIDEPLSTT